MRACAAIVIAVAVATGAPAPASAQSRLPSVTGLLDRINTETSVRAVDAVPGGSVVLEVEIRPNRGIRVFAPGARSFVPAMVVLN